MPVVLPFSINNLSASEFDAIDKAVMRCAYDSQNELGRLCDERVYENDLALRLRESGLFEVHTQVPVVMSHGSFVKEYQLDLLVNDALYELKTVAAFAARHEAQALGYAMMAGVNHVKLNFRRGKVQGKLLFNALLPAARHHLSWEVKGWRELTEQCRRLRAYVEELMMDWGGYLEACVYEEALVHLFGGEGRCKVRVPVMRGTAMLGKHPINQHIEGLGFTVTAFGDVVSQRRHISQLRRLTGCKAIHWINISRGIVHLETLTDT